MIRIYNAGPNTPRPAPIEAGPTSVVDTADTADTADTSGTAPAPFDTLPVEMLLKISRHLDRRDFVAFNQVDSHTNAVLKDSLELSAHKAAYCKSLCDKLGEADTVVALAPVFAQASRFLLPASGPRPATAEDAAVCAALVASLKRVRVDSYMEGPVRIVAGRLWVSMARMRAHLDAVVPVDTRAVKTVNAFSNELLDSLFRQRQYDFSPMRADYFNTTA